jgi:hypothetical protein
VSRAGTELARSIGPVALVDLSPKPRRGRRGAALLLGASLALAAAAAATPTDPTLALTGATAAAGAAGTAARMLRIEGSFQADDLVQLAYPLQLLVRETTTGTTYVRYDLSSGAVTGSSAALADGLQAGEVNALLGQGTAEPAARVLFLGLGRLDVALPPSFPGGPAEALLFVVDEGETILSNPIPLAVGAAP